MLVWDPEERDRASRGAERGKYGTEGEGTSLWGTPWVASGAG